MDTTLSFHCWHIQGQEEEHTFHTQFNTFQFGGTNKMLKGKCSVGIDRYGFFFFF